MSWLGREDFVLHLNKYEKYTYAFLFSYLTVSAGSYAFFYAAKDQIIHYSKQSIELSEKVSQALHGQFGRRAQSFALYKKFSGPLRLAIALPMAYVAAQSMINEPERWDLSEKK